jgi:ABC-type polysaccharide/polyol phosphate export permease
MFDKASASKPPSALSSAFTMSEVIYHSTVRSVRKTHANALMALTTNMIQIVVFILAFYVMFSLLGVRGAAIRGDFLIYIMTGVFLFMTHTKSLSAVLGSEGPASPMMQHAPMNTLVSIISSALGALYIQVLSLFIILFIYHVAFTPFVIEDIPSAFGMLILSWFTGCGLGLVLLALKPWAPTFVNILSTVYQRANMLASGKMFVASTMPAHLLPWFTWNPLFHTIDQSRGFVFINYTASKTSWEYALWLGIVFLVIGLMGEFYTRRHASLSWNARR